MNLSTYDLYLKKEGSWEKITNIKKDDRPTWASVDIQNKKYFQENWHFGYGNISLINHISSRYNISSALKEEKLSISSSDESVVKVQGK